MPPAEHVVELVSIALKARLAAIDATAYPTRYWYTPTKVLRVDIHDAKYLRKKLPDAAGGGDIDTLYLQMPGDANLFQRTTGTVRHRADFWVLACKLLDTESQDPWHRDSHPELLLKETVQARLRRDVLVAIEQDVTLGMTGAGVIAKLEDENPITVEEAANWATVELHITVEFDTFKAAMA